MRMQPLSICDECFSPLEVVVDLDAARKTVTRESIAQGPPICGATRRCCRSPKITFRRRLRDGRRW